LTRKHALPSAQITFYTAHFDVTTAQIVINCTLKYALAYLTSQTMMLDQASTNPII